MDDKKEDATSIAIVADVDADELNQNATPTTESLSTTLNLETRCHDETTTKCTTTAVSLHVSNITNDNADDTNMPLVRPQTNLRNGKSMSSSEDCDNNNSDDTNNGKIIHTKTTGSDVVVPNINPLVLSFDDNNNPAAQAAIAAAIQTTRNEMQVQLDATRQELLKAKHDLVQQQQIHQSTNKKQSVQQRQDNNDIDLTEEEINHSHVPDNTKMVSNIIITRSTRSTRSTVSLKGNITEKMNSREKRKSLTTPTTKDGPKKRAATTTLEKRNTRNKDALLSSSSTKKKKQEMPKKLDTTSSSPSIKDNDNHTNPPLVAARITRSSLLSRHSSNKLDTTTTTNALESSKRSLPSKRKKLKDHNDKSDDEQHDPNLEINDNGTEVAAVSATRSSTRSLLSKIDNSDNTVRERKRNYIKPPSKRKKLEDHDNEIDYNEDDPKNHENDNGANDNNEDNNADINSDDSDAKVPAVAATSSSSKNANTNKAITNSPIEDQHSKTVVKDNNTTQKCLLLLDDDDADATCESKLLDDDTKCEKSKTSKVIPVKAKPIKVKTTSRKKQNLTDSLLRKSENKLSIDHSKINAYDDSLLLTDDSNKIVDLDSKKGENDIYWSNSFADLHTFRYIHGHCNVGLVTFHVPAAKKRYKQLYLFVKTIRDEYNNATHHQKQFDTYDDEQEAPNNKSNNDSIQIEKQLSEKLVLNDKRIADLLELGFNFDWNSDVHLSIDDFVVTKKKKLNDANQKQGEVVTMKKTTKKKNVPSFDLLWEKRFSELRNFAKTHGNCDARESPSRNVENDTKEAAMYRTFFAWVKQVRYFFRRRIEQELMLLHPEYQFKKHKNAPSIIIVSTLTNERIISLIKVGFHFNRYSPREELPTIRISSQAFNESDSIANPAEEDNKQGAKLTDSERVEDPKINGSRDDEKQMGDHTDDESPRERNKQRVYGHGLGNKKKERPILTIDPCWQENWEKIVQLLHEYKSTYGSVAELAGYKLDELDQTKMQIAPIDDRYKDLRRWIDTVRYYLNLYRNDTSEVQFFNEEKIETLLEISLSLVQDPPPEIIHHKRPKKSTVKETLKALRADGRKMTGQEIKDMEWERNFQELKRFYIEHQTLVLPLRGRGKVDDQYRDLRSWVSAQRNHYENMMSGKWKSSQMTAQRVAKLMEIGFRFKKLKVWTFEERIEQYKKYLETHNGKHPTGTTGDGLGSFVTVLRKNYKKIVKGQSCNLDQGQIDILKSIGFSFNEKFLLKHRDPPSAPVSWEEIFASLIEYKEKHGDFNVPTNSMLSKWCRTQRHLYRQYLVGKTSYQIAERVLKLQNIGFKFVIRDPNYVPRHLRPRVSTNISWDDSYHKLIEFKKVNGHTRASTHKKNDQLGHWVCSQRKQYNRFISGRKSSMSEEKITKLNEIGFEFSLLKSGGSGAHAKGGSGTITTRRKSSSNVIVANASPGEDPTRHGVAKDDDNETESSDSDSSSSSDDEEEHLRYNNQVNNNADDDSSSEGEEEEQEGYEYQHNENPESANAVSAVSHQQSDTYHLSHEENEYVLDQQQQQHQHQTEEEAEQSSSMNNVPQPQQQQQNYLQQGNVLLGSISIHPEILDNLLIQHHEESRGQEYQQYR